MTFFGPGTYFVATTRYTEPDTCRPAVWMARATMMVQMLPDRNRPISEPTTMSAMPTIIIFRSDTKSPSEP